MFFLKYLVAILNKVEYFSTFFVACFWLWVSLHAVVWNWQFGGAVLLYVSPSAETSLNFSLSLDWGYGFDIKLKQDFITLNRGYTIKMIYHLRCWPWFVAEAVSVRFLHCEAFFPLDTLYSLKGPQVIWYICEMSGVTINFLNGGLAA